MAEFGLGAEGLEGVITGFSDSGSVHRAYAIVEVSRTQSFIVPVKSLTLVSDNEPGGLSAEG